MSETENFFNIDDLAQGISRELGPGLSTRIFAGDHAMVSVVRVEPGAVGTLHHHPEEQRGLMLEGPAVRVQGDVEVAVKTGDFWRTPGNVPHTIRAGPDGAVILDVFSPPRAAYTKPGSGFATDD